MAVCLAVGLSGSGVAALALRGWTLALHAPRFCPPIRAYAPVWAVLYIMAGIAGWEIWRAPDVSLRHHHALNAWGMAMALKALWTPVFFGLHWLAAALAVGTVLLGVLAVTSLRFWRLNRAAALLMLPFCAWVGFEVYLDAGFWWLNR